MSKWFGHQFETLQYLVLLVFLLFFFSVGVVVVVDDDDDDVSCNSVDVYPFL